jgi:hypothetical protein
VPVAGHDTPEHLVSPGGERGQAHFEEGIVSRVDVPVPLVHLTLVLVLYSEAAEDGFDRAVKPDPDRRRR